MNKVYLPSIKKLINRIFADNMKPIRAVVLLFFISLMTGIAFTANAQSIPQNLANTNVNELSDAQVKQLLQQAQASGLSDQQLLQEAANRGLPPDQVQALEKRITKVKNTNNDTGNLPDTGLTQGRKLNYSQDSLNGASQKSAPNSDLFGSLQPKIFGADLFRNKNLTFEPNLNLATPINYVVGPGDQLNINVYGRSVANWKLPVSAEGNINIPGVGLINVTGKTIEQATNLIKNRLQANNYAIGRGTNVL